MKTNKHILRIALLSTAFVVNVGLFINIRNNPTELDAYDSSDLPTTIDLNDCSEEEIRSYYSNLNSLDVSERKGTNLLKNLKPILANNQKYYSYDISKGEKIWKIYEIADRDWEKSPASSTTYGTYSAVTNKITNYKYGNNSDHKNDPYVHALYINRNIDNQVKAWGNHNQDAWGINREHIWAKSHGFQDEGTNGARGDPMHLWAANGWANHEHSNNFFAFVDKSRDYKDCGDDYNTIHGNYTGYSLNAGGSQTVFEPQDCDKGDIARSIFYMVARYNNYANDASGIDTDNPNLVLLNDLSENGRTGTSDATHPYGMGLLSDLLAWNKLDPVDEYEIHRNNLLYRNYTNNRNPFIDFPEWADAIWGTADLDGSNYISTPSGMATPSTDPINSESNDTFAISLSSIDLQVDETIEIYGRNADSNISGSVDDNTVVSLDKNTTSNNERVTITALKSGSATITATSGGDSATCEVRVTNINYGTLEHPLSVDEAIEVISITGANATQDQLYVKGIVTSNSIYNTTNNYNNYDYVWLQSDDGTNPQALELFRIKPTNGIESTYSTVNSMVGKEVLAYGYGQYYQSTTYELSKANGVSPEILSINDPAGPSIDDYLDNTSPYLDLLAKENRVDPHTVSTTFGNNMTNEQVLGDSFTIGDVNLAGAKGTHVNAVPKYYTNGAALRLYAGNTLTFTSSYSIKRIEFTFKTDYTSDFTPNSGSFTLDNLTGVWTGSSTSVVFSVDSNSRITAVSISYGESSFSVSNVALRFGIVIPKADWSSIHSNWPITDYGVMIIKKTTLNNTYGVSSIAEAYDNSENLLDLHKGTYAEPWAMDEDNYAFSVKLNMTSVSSYAITYCAAPYIVANGTYYFLDQIETSVNDLASDYLDNGGSSLSNEALTLLSTTH